MMDPTALTTLLVTLVAAAVIGLWRLSRQVTQLDTAIRGMDGNNGLIGTVKEVRGVVTELTDRLTAVEGDVRHLGSGRRGHVT